MMNSEAMEDEEKWLAEAIAGIQHNAYYMHRALVKSFNSNFISFHHQFIIIICDFSHRIQIISEKP